MFILTDEDKLLKQTMQEVDTTDRGICTKGWGGCAKLHVTDWLNDIKTAIPGDDIVEVRFKNTRKDYYRNVNNLNISVGDLVAVEGSPGHDIGIISLKGELVFEQMKRHKVTLNNGEFRKVYRKAKTVDIDKWKEAISLEHETMIKSRQIVQDLGLDMKIGDVEYQGDRTKAIFYYIADGRVDFRQLIKVLAESFRIRIEMKQIGARQEAGRIGGIGPCGRELCCSTWMSNFVSVTTNAARYQEISLNPQKLAGQCGKLKCCLNFEVDSYIDAQKDFPPSNIPLHSENLTYHFLKADIFGGIYWYALQGNGPSNLVPVPVRRVKEVQRMNRNGKKPEKLVTESFDVTAKNAESFQNVVGQDDLHRFDQPKRQMRKKSRSKRRNPNQAHEENKTQNQGQRQSRPQQGQRNNEGQASRNNSNRKSRRR
ncbi:regulatory iron-sulfur-containing complex subunit RicT [Prolixibacteraceae bacterium Z1-6]|uniref:Regulatory iron-sulfur-containing complex subunit RicT n=1 Tax=Draconibacterium aestuarii TaxID=2998507 RepID=A0A9X3J6R3_9BACT|nr:regulatory iron-sulfur-containing complex subunit RicT [Prolixibacteraceae bacterium Z1-6]